MRTYGRGRTVPVLIAESARCRRVPGRPNGVLVVIDRDTCTQRAARCHRERARRGLALVALVVVLTGASACGSGGPGDRQVAIDATTYIAAIQPFLPPNTDPDVRPVVYVVPVGDRALALDTQVAVIDAFAEFHDVRFVDSHDAAVEDDVDGRPPRDDGMLVGVGTVSESEPHTLRVEVYEAHDRVEAHRVTVGVRGGRWVVEEVEDVEPEVLVDE